MKRSLFLVFVLVAACCSDQVRAQETTAKDAPGDESTSNSLDEIYARLGGDGSLALS